MKTTAWQTLNVSLVIRSKKISLREMTKSLGLPEKEISSEKGLKIRLPSKKLITRDSACWAVESKLPETKSLDQHLKETLKIGGNKAELAKNKYGNKVRISLRIGVFYKGARGRCDINSKAIKKLLPFVDVIEISTYPCSP